jgi:hypothetical protein
MPATNSQKSDRRVQFDLSETLLEEIDDLMADCEIATKKELLNNAVTAFQWMVEQIKDGRLVVSADREKNDFEVFWMPALRAAQRVAKSKPVARDKHR